MRLIIHMLLLCILLATALPAAALQVDPEQPVHPPVEADANANPESETYQGGGVTLEQAIRQVRRQYNGQIVSATTVVNGNRETHIIKVLERNGTVRTVRVAGRNRG